MKKENFDFGTILGSVVVALGFAVPCSAQSAPAVEREIVKLEPLLHFEVNGVAVKGENENQKYWNELMKYKLWATDSIVFNKELVRIAEPSGYTGTAKGDVIFINGRHTLGGPIISGRNLRLSYDGTDGRQESSSPDLDTLVSGLVYAKNLYLAAWYNAPNSVYDSVYCFAGHVYFRNGEGRNTEWVNRFITNAHKKKGRVFANWEQSFDGMSGLSGLNLDGTDCPDYVPRPDTNLSVPLIDTTGLAWEPAKDLKSNVYGETDYIHIPPITEEDVKDEHTWYDKFIERIYFEGNYGKKLYILMPSKKQNYNGKTGRLTRIFLRDSIGIHSSANDTKIQVAYVDNEATWDDSKNAWNFDASKITVVHDTNYAGNLLFYTTHDIKWPSMNGNMETDLQGTFISTGNITVQDHFSIAGQLIAGKALWMESHLDGEFHYVPFNSPEIKTDVFVKDVFKEKDNYWYSMDFYLTDTARTEVSFDYCFAFFGVDVDTTGGKYDGYKSSTGSFGSLDDLADNPTDEDDVNYMPFCKDGKSKHVVIKKGDRMPTVPYYSAHIGVKEDLQIEGDEYMLFKIMNLNGAVISGNKFDGGLLVQLKDSDNKPPHFVDPDNINLAVPENATKSKAGTVKAKDDEGDYFEYAIKDGTAKDLFEINSTTGVVTMKDGVDAFDFEAWKESGTVYDIKVEICNAGVTATNHNYLCDDYTFTINITDVNETPYFTYKPDDEKTLKIAEGNAPAYSDEAVKFADTDTYTDKDGNVIKNSKFTNDAVYAIGGDTDVFDVTKNGIVYTKNGVVLDYETKNTYKLTLRVQDDTKDADGNLLYPDLYEDMEFTIIVTDVEDGPKFELDTYNGNIDENSAATTPVVMDYAINATTTQIGATITYILLDESKSFVINPSSGVITVAAGAVLDYETKSVYEMKVVASDVSGVAGQKVQTDTAVVIIKINDVNENPVFVETDTLKFPENKKGYEIGTLTFDDLDTASKFRKNKFECLNCDESGFYLDENTGELSTTRKFDYETEPKTYKLDIVIKDANKANLSTTGTVIVELTNVYEFTELVYNVPETDTVGTTFKKALEVDNAEGSNTTLKFFILDGSTEVGATNEFKLDSVTGKFSVASPLDYETKDSYSIRVRAKDENGVHGDTTVTINVIDVNEAASILVDTIYVYENQTVNETFSTVRTDNDDPDTKNPDFRNNVYDNTDNGGVVQIMPNGDAILLKPIDYEADSIYVITARVTDKDDRSLTSTKNVVVKVLDVYEKSEVEITRVEDPDSVYLNTNDTIFVNHEVVEIEWKQDEKIKSSTDSLKLGCNEVIKTFHDKTKNDPGADTVIICYSNAAPVVTVTANGSGVAADNIYTVVEKATKNDTAIYVNNVKNDIKVTVLDTVTHVSDAFTVNVELNTVSLSASEFKNVKSVADSKVTRNKKPASGITSVPENGTYIKNSYTETVKGLTVTVSYYTDKKGKDIKQSVVTASGKTKEIAVIEVSYTTKVGDMDVTVSYFADASTGERVMLNTGVYDSESVLSADGDDVRGSYKVHYTYEDRNGNTADISYYLDENGNIAKNNDGNIGYNVGYTYVNKYGNASKKEVLIVLDQKGPVVKIQSPVEDEVLTSNFATVKWTVNGVVQDTLSVQGLENGVQTIVRVFRDKAGNESRDSVHVMVKNVKNIDINVEKPVTLVDRDSVEKYYKSNPPKKDQNYTVSFYNYKKKAETETIVGIKNKPSSGSGREPYQGFEGGHLGPTLSVDARVPVANALGGLATLDDIMTSDGMIALDGVDAANSRKVTVSEYVEQYCTDEFRKSMTSDYSKMNLYWTTLKVNIWVYSNTGVFADHFSFEYNLDDPEYVNEAGLLKFFFEMKPDENGDVRTKDGRLYGTGAYIFKTDVKMTSKLRCDLPTRPDEENKANKKRNVVIKSSDELLKAFGYRRPVNK